MKILQIHNEYLFKGGEDTILNSEKKVLENNKNIVRQIIRKNSLEIRSLKDKMTVFKNLNYSIKSKDILNRTIASFKPDLAHIHNSFPLWSSSIIELLNDFNIPIVMTVNNFRFMCLNGQLYRNNKVCTKCLDGNIFNGVKYKCYQNSYLKSYAVYSYLKYIKNNKILNKIDRFIVNTSFTKNLFSKIINKKKIIIKPNFVFDHKIKKKDIKKDKYFLFIGRLSDEKGLDIILNNIDNFQLKIKIVGDGPMFNELKNLNHPKLIVLGKKNKNQILKLMSEATCLLFPSKWYEGMPLVLLEALSVGLPIVASNIGNMKFIIKNNYNGLLFNINDTGKLSKYANNIFNNKKLRLKLETNAKKIYHQRYTDKLNYIKLIKIYKDVIDSKKL
tara:strand:- start:502 stop:1665 length:1164 start_codon:yes stop_codon:yes gene_type:complete